MEFKKDGKDLELITNYCDYLTSRLLITKNFYLNWKKLPNGIRPFGFFIILPPLKQLEKFVDKVLPPLPNSNENSSDIAKDKGDYKSLLRKLARQRLKNETSNKSV